MDNSQYKTVTQ